MASEFVFAHLADAHVGAWPRDPAVRAALRQSVLKAFETVEARGAAFLLISGDLFHTPVPDPGEVAPVAAALKRLVDRGIRVYVIYGSHDYVAHRTSWLDVLAETGIFLRAAPEAVQSEGQRLTLPYLRDAGTGAVIAGISGRSHGLDREYFRSLDSEAFRAEPGFKVFQFHAAVTEYLPESLRAHIQGVGRSDLPGGCDYYAGGHIHVSYTGEGPEGGLLVNPGAVFGTSVTDLENGVRGKTHQGVVIVTVRNGVPGAEFVDTAPREAIAVVEVDVSGRTPEEARRLVAAEVVAHAAPGRLIFPRVRGTLSEGSSGTLGLRASEQAAEARGAVAVHWDVRDIAPAPGETPLGEEQLETETFRELARTAPPELAELTDAGGERRIRELVRELSLEATEGERRQDYLDARVKGSLAVLRVLRRPSSDPPGA
ncbi:MAG TPA: metallophosphoesterase [Thermoplasmata archaeon]|nr:metallophosphoesterase [Thermoplasmata archaeon]